MGGYSHASRRRHALQSSQGTTGRWILTGDGGTPVIVIRWDVHGTESVAMVTPDHFRGQIRNGRFMDMVREEGQASEKTSNEQAGSVQH